MSSFIFSFMKNCELHLENLCDIFTFNTKYGAIAATGTTIFVLAGVYIASAYIERAWRAKHEGHKMFTRSMSIGVLHGGKQALERLIDYHHARADAASINSAETQLRVQLREGHIDFSKLQSIVTKLEMGGKESVAVDLLSSELKRARSEGQPHEAYEFEMLLVEMYIYMGDTKKALECECLSHVEITDARRPLYKAVIHIIREESVHKAFEYWEEFKQIKAHFQSPEDSYDGKLITDFNEFKTIVKVLKNDILKIHGRITK
ncbi:hypothetical protein K2173_006740 [Erythroxylum novogranatense]|uniref:Uncharacterized protein n=1 Tax=Erythroxylum novogranatense TaxID=1862640 RepID=A0AAV8T6S0_9ROSI|nr:hypothetical protein K2173_006740 [Erythroxylum novogranatense]